MWAPTARTWGATTPTRPPCGRRPAPACCWACPVTTTCGARTPCWPPEPTTSPSVRCLPRPPSPRPCMRRCKP
ncbi:Uncharacterised protein [Bordetella pertussis]|nr:Uncharacterised protein [Bordetella pertussis]